MRLRSYGHNSRLLTQAQGYARLGKHTSTLAARALALCINHASSPGRSASTMKVHQHLPRQAGSEARPLC